MIADDRPAPTSSDLAALVDQAASLIEKHIRAFRDGDEVGDEYFDALLTWKDVSRFLAEEVFHLAQMARPL